MMMIDDLLHDMTAFLLLLLLLLQSQMHWSMVSLVGVVFVFVSSVRAQPLSSSSADRDAIGP